MVRLSKIWKWGGQKRGDYLEKRVNTGWNWFTFSAAKLKMIFRALMASSQWLSLLVSTDLLAFIFGKLKFNWAVKCFPFLLLLLFVVKWKGKFFFQILHLSHEHGRPLRILIKSIILKLVYRLRVLSELQHVVFEVSQFMFLKYD